MSKKAMLQSLLWKVARGDKTSIVKLCNIIAGEEVYIPTLKVQETNGSSTKVSVMRLREGDRRLVPIFTTEGELTEWMSVMGIAGSTMPLLCSDLCLTLDNQTWLLIETQGKGAVELEPKYVKLIANTELDFISEMDDEEPEEDTSDVDEDIKNIEALNAALESAQPIISKPPQPLPVQPQPPKQVAPQERAMGRTQVVPVVPKTIAELQKLSEELAAANSETSSSSDAVSSGVRKFRDNDKDDSRSTVDLTAVVRKARESS